MIFAINSAVFGTGLSLGAVSMLSIGPNNLMLIREGLARGRIVTVATAVWGSYVLLLALALLFADVSQWAGPWTRASLSWFGLSAVCWFAFSSLRMAFSNAGQALDQVAERRQACVRRVLAVVWLNPLTYLELLLVPAAFCTTLDGLLLRSQFIGAVIIMGALNCFGYAYGGSVCGLFIRDRRWVRSFDLASGLLLAGAALWLAARLIAPSL